MFSKYLGDQWRIGDWAGMLAAAPDELPPWIAGMMAAAGGGEPPPNLREYDPEWGWAFWTGTVGESCPHQRMLAAVKVPVLFTHHFRSVDEETGALMGASSDLQAAHVVKLVEGTGQPITYQSHPTMGHSMHGQDPELFAAIVTEWAAGL